MIAEQASVHAWVAIGISVVALIVTCLWNLHLARQARRSADAAEKMAGIAADTHKKQIVNESQHSIRLVSFRWQGLGIHEVIDVSRAVVLGPKEAHDYELGDLLRQVARDEKKDIRGWVLVDDLKGRRWKQEWGFSSDGRKAWAAGIEEWSG